jgi:hypothetical protein
MLLHSTYKLQPLDVGLFGLLSTAYLKQINNLMHQSLGLVFMSKRFFYQVFKEAWAKSFTKEHIQNAFKKTGIWPLALENVLSTIRKIPDKPSTPTKSGVIKTPKTTWAICRAHAIYQKEAKSLVLNKIFNTNIQLAAQVAIQ